jgi:glycosyltransferase involved in cell wall biosynthesis
VISKTPAISVVLPTHNGSRYIDQSIKSVVDQTFRDWEMIVVDDASTDDTPAMVDQWAAADQRIKVVHLVKNRKLPGALNEGFAQAQGDFHTWTSDDNWYHPEAFAGMFALLQREPDVSIVHADNVGVNQYGKVIARVEVGPAEELYAMNLIGACFLYRREVTTALKGYDEDLFGAEDYDFWLRASLRFAFRRVPEFLYFYRFHANSLSARKRDLIHRNVETAVRRWLPQMNWQDDAARKRAYTEWGFSCLRAGTWDDVFLPWLQHAEWLDVEERVAMRRAALTRATKLAWEAHCHRDWREYDRFTNLLSEVKDDPAVARFFAKKRYPRWLYIVKDIVTGIRERLHSSLAGGAT